MPPKRLKLLLLLAAYHQLYRRAPTIRELSQTMGNGPGMSKRLQTLKRLGLVSWTPHHRRTLRVTPAGLAALADHQPVLAIERLP